MPSFPDSIFLFVLALLLFGPKRLPVLARELGKWVGEFRRASNDFKLQMEEELRMSEHAEREKKIAAMEAAAPVAPPVVEAEQEQLSAPEQALPAANAVEAPVEAVAEISASTTAVVETETAADAPRTSYEVVDGVRTPVPIAVSGDLKIMPPRTGLPVAQSAGPRNSSLKGLLDAIPAAEPASEAAPAAETTAHGD